MWIVSVYRDLGYNIEQYKKHFKDEVDAYDHFESEIRDEFEYEILEGLVTDQELQNIINNEVYRFEDETKQIMINIEEDND